jgi:hypothetical protein
VSYSIWKINQATSLFEEVDGAEVNDKPALRQHTLTFDEADTGSTFTFKLRASTNEVDFTESLTFSFVLAAVPDQPPSVPQLNLEHTTGRQIHISYAAMAVELNGGAAILSYEVSLYHKASQKWISIAGGLNDFSLLTETIYLDAVNQGETY